MSTPAEAHQRALETLERGDAADAFAQLRELAREGTPTELLNDLAVVAHRLGRVEDALALLHAVAVIDPTDADARANLVALGGDPPAEARTAEKEAAELGFWQERKAAEGTLSNEHYEFFYTGFFGLTVADYDGLRVLDVGCGPRGSLEWAHGAARRVGLDPLADEYLRLGADQHAMEYVAAGAEHTPFEDGAFDVVTCFNALDHVEDVDASIRELCRLVAPGGQLLLICDVNHDPTPFEPHDLGWDLPEAFAPELEVADVRHFEKHIHGVYQSLLEPIPYDHDRPERRYGILAARLQRPAR